jgi:hypothetical protein
VNTLLNRIVGPDVRNLLEKSIVKAYAVSKAEAKAMKRFYSEIYKNGVRVFNSKGFEISTTWYRALHPLTQLDYEVVNGNTNEVIDPYFGTYESKATVNAITEQARETGPAQASQLASKSLLNAEEEAQLKAEEALAEQIEAETARENARATALGFGDLATYTARTQAKIIELARGGSSRTAAP